MNRTLLILLAVTLVQYGCANEPAGGIAVAPATPKQEQELQEEKGIVDKVTGLVEQAKSKAPSLDDMKKMLNNAGDATGQTADDTMKWVNKTYKSLSERGLTNAKSASDWVADDWNGMNAWEYKVLSVAADDLATLETKLNEAGTERWDCFHVSEGAGNTKFFLKRQKKSYLRNIPLKDLMILIPFMDNQ